MDLDLETGEVLSEALLGSVENPLSVGDFTDLIKTRLESEFSDVVITGEISNFKPHPSGHHYFSLKDERAAISAAMFKGSNSKLKFQLQDGMKVVAFGRISVYPPRGNYQIIVTRLEPAGLGALQMAFEQLKRKLEAEGLFAKERKRPIPSFPKCVGLVTASSGAALRDMLNVLHRRFAGLHIMLMPVKVQGNGSAEEIALAINWFNKFFPEVDVLIVGRGGGSLEDLWAFNEEPVARSIFKSRIPVISAVGHEVDFTIADFVADLRAPTPSAAAELVVGNKLELLKHLDHLVARLSQIVQRLDYARMRLDDLAQRLNHILEQRLAQLSLAYERLQSRLSRVSPFARLEQMRSRILREVERLPELMRVRMKELQSRIQSSADKLRILSPLSVMERGYSIVRSERTGQVLRKASDVVMGDKLEIQLWKGKIRARV